MAGIRLASGSTTTTLNQRAMRLMKLDPNTSLVPTEKSLRVWRYMPFRNLLRMEAMAGIWMCSLERLRTWSAPTMADIREGDVPPGWAHQAEPRCGLAGVAAYEESDPGDAENQERDLVGDDVGDRD